MLLMTGKKEQINFHSQWRKEKIEPTKDQPKVVVLDLGCKLNSLRCFTERGCEVEVVPAPTTAADLRALNPNGIFISNGPGDPEKVESAVTAVRDLLGEIPIFGNLYGTPGVVSSYWGKNL